MAFIKVTNDSCFLQQQSPNVFIYTKMLLPCTPKIHTHNDLNIIYIPVHVLIYKFKFIKITSFMCCSIPLNTYYLKIDILKEVKDKINY